MNGITALLTLLNSECSNTSKFSLAQSVSIYGNAVYELITEIERSSQNAGNVISEVENVITIIKHEK